MLRSHTRSLVISCTQNTIKLQAVADMLLLSDHSWPVTPHEPHSSSFHKCKDFLQARIKALLVIITRTNECFMAHTPSWVELSSALQSMLESVTEIIELCAHISYLLVELFPSCRYSVPGVIDQYKVRKAYLDIKMHGNLIKISSHEQLSPPILVEIAACLNENLSRITKYCTSASDTVANSLDREQLGSCVKSLAANGSCVMTSIRVFKAEPNEEHVKRCVSFYDSLIMSAGATSAFLTEGYFIGKPAVLNKDATDCRKKILGACMNVVSSCIQLYNTVKEYAYDVRNPFIHDRLVKCTAAVNHATVPLNLSLNVHKASQESSQSGPDN